MNRTILPIYLLSLFFHSEMIYSADLITLKAGDIFLGDIAGKNDSHYQIKRGGFITIIPKWEIRSIVNAQTFLPMSAEAKPFLDTIASATGNSKTSIPPPGNIPGSENPDEPQPKNVRLFDLMGISIPVVSAPPAEPSHLEIHPKKSRWESFQNRYLRGYLANQTERGYHSLRLEITYYTEIPGLIGSATSSHTDFRQTTEIFDVYPNTMKPFRVDTRFVEWDRVKRIQIQIVGKTPMTRQ